MHRRKVTSVTSLVYTVRFVSMRSDDSAGHRTNTSELSSVPAPNQGPNKSQVTSCHCFLIRVFFTATDLIHRSMFRAAVPMFTARPRDLLPRTEDKTSHSCMLLQDGGLTVKGITLQLCITLGRTTCQTPASICHRSCPPTWNFLHPGLAQFT
jgi:hypothetical protein